MKSESMVAIEKINIFRVLTTSMLIAIIGVGGAGSYLILKEIENDTKHRQFDSYSDQIKHEVEKSIQRTIFAGKSLAKIYANHCPSDEDWPLCLLDLPYMEYIQADLFAMANIPGFGFSVFVTSDEQAQFEKDIYQIYQEYNVANSSFGWGIYGLSREMGGSDFRYPITNGSFGQTALAPLIQMSDFRKNINLTMYDELSERTRFLALRELCEYARSNASRDKYQQISILSDIITFPQSLTQLESEISPRSLLFTSVQPPLSNSSEVRGTVITGIDWANILSDIIPRDIEGIKIIVAINYEEYIYKIHNSEGVFLRSNTLKKAVDPSMCKRHEKCINLDLFEGESTYILWVERSSSFDAQYESMGPILAPVIFTIMIVLLSTIFLAYDMFVNKEILQKEIVLKTKQLFVRYISHEIRTPINTIHIGISLILQELNSVLNKKGSSPKTPNHLPSGAVLIKDGLEDEEKANDGDNSKKESQDVITRSATQGSGIHLSADQLEEKVKLWLDMIFDIEASSTAAIQVLNDLLDYEQIQISKLNMDMTLVSMWSLCEGIFTSFRFNMDSKRITHTLTMDLTGPFERSMSSNGTSLPATAHSEDISFLKKLVVLGDEKKLEQVMRNLVSNAMKFTPVDGEIAMAVTFIPDVVPASTGSENKVTVRQKSLIGFTDNEESVPIALSLPPGSMKNKVQPYRSMNGMIVVTVTDTGAGLDQDQLQQLFAEGVQFNPNRLQDGQGSGLGLWITKGIVKEHKGRIFATSDGIGRGTVFTVQLPCHYDESFEYVPARKLRPSQGGDDKVLRVVPDVDIKKILLVDDSLANVKVCKRLLTNAGFEVEVAYNGEECIRKLETDNYADICQLLIIDNHMPVMDGPTTVKEIRRRNYPFPIFGLTGSITPQELSDFAAAGCDSVLSKPLSIAMFNDILASVKKGHQKKLESEVQTRSPEESV